MTTEQQTTYDESDFDILEGLEPVKLRPDMYTRTENPLHIIQEVIDNSVDEALAGFTTKIDVTLNKDGTVVVADNGRGIPTGIHKKKHIPVVQAAFCLLHAGGKFNKKDANSAYRYSGGLHGVGVAVTNALSERVEVEVKREGQRYRIVFENGDVVVPLETVGKARGSGTQVCVKPNPKYFHSAEIPLEELKRLLRSKAALLPGLQISLTNHRVEGPAVTETWQYEEGLVSLLAQITKEEAPLVPVFSGERYMPEGDENFAEGEGAAWAFAWFESGRGDGQSFTNLIPTPEGGTHVAGLRSAVFECVKTFVDLHGLLPKGIKLTAEDAFRNVSYVLSAKVLDPAFANQTKDKLTSREAVKLVEKSVRGSFEVWLNHNVAQGKTIADIAIRNAMARQKAASKVERKKTSGVVLLPGKLADCESDDPSVAELFLVEGDSAGGSAKLGRSKDFQAILPMRGKGLNTWEVDRNEALSNEEIHDISVAIGVDPHTLNDEIDWKKLRYGKIGILSDADVDGFHIQVLLLTLFLRHFPQLIERGHIYVARPPLYRIDTDSAGKKRQAKKIYAMDDEELKTWEDRLRKEGYPTWRIGRFKGLGEMGPEELWETTLSPDTRRLLQVVLPEELKEESKQTFDMLMSKGRAASRREWMERRGNEVE